MSPRAVCFVLDRLTADELDRTRHSAPKMGALPPPAADARGRAFGACWGDGRRRMARALLNLVEQIAGLAGADPLDTKTLSARPPPAPRGANTTSPGRGALQPDLRPAKSRGRSDPDASPLLVRPRCSRAARAALPSPVASPAWPVEDDGLADPEAQTTALRLAVPYESARFAEGELALAQAVVLPRLLAPIDNRTMSATRRPWRGKEDRIGAAAAPHPKRATNDDERTGLRRGLCL